MYSRSHGAGRNSRLSEYFVALRAGALFALLLASVACRAFDGQVVGIHDGDTLTVLVAQQQIKVRLASIDAPERKQPFGTKSRESLAEICHGKQATVTPTARPSYGRVVGEVVCDGVPASSEQVRRGMAWVYPKYAPKRSPLFQIEAEARAGRLGLWSDPSPTSPWEFRRSRK